MSKTILAGRLHAFTDGWLLIIGGTTVLVDVMMFNLLTDPVLREGNDVTISGEMGVPPTSNERKLIAEKIIGHDAIRAKAFEISRSPRAGSDVENWLLAERELLSTQPPALQG
jgi:hypothetical protein